MKANLCVNGYNITLQQAAPLDLKPVKHPFAFNRALRVLQAFQFKVIFDAPTLKVHQPCFTLLAIPFSQRVDLTQTDNKKPRLGLVIAKKKIRRAHERNRVKRLMRESFRLNQTKIPAYDLVMIAKGEAQTLSNEQVFANLEEAWLQLKRKHQAHLQKQISATTTVLSTSDAITAQTTAKA